MMQTTSNLWEVLCRDLESERRNANSEEYQVIAKRFLDAAKRILRPSSPRLCDAIEIAGDFCQASGSFEEAASNFGEALSKSIKLGATTSAARLAAKLALLREHLGDEQSARFHYEQALDLYETSRDFSQHSMLLNRLGSLCARQEDTPGAEKFFQRAMELVSRTHGPDHPDLATAANNLGVAYCNARDYVKAENLHMQALSIRERAFGAMHPDVALSMANLGVVYHARGNYQKALSYYEGALATYRCFHKEDAPEIQEISSNRDAVLEKLAAK